MSGGTTTLDKFQPTLPLHRGASIQERFERFDMENPRIYELYKKFSLELYVRGRRKCGISLITERIRWEVIVTTTGQDFKISNDFRSRYARKLMKENIALNGFFFIKQLRTA